MAGEVGNTMDMMEAKVMDKSTTATNLKGENQVSKDTSNLLSSHLTISFKQLRKSQITLAKHTRNTLVCL